MSSPILSVRSEGPRRWRIAVRERREADVTRLAFQHKGLRCGPIREFERHFEFHAEASTRHALSESDCGGK